MREVICTDAAGAGFFHRGRVTDRGLVATTDRVLGEQHDGIADVLGEQHDGIADHVYRRFESCRGHSPSIV